MRAHLADSPPACLLFSGWRVEGGGLGKVVEYRKKKFFSFQRNLIYK